MPLNPIVGSAVLGTGGGLLDAFLNRWNVRKTIEAQKAESELAYQRGINMWNMQNAYNSPEAQMNRFKAAGLNPHLIYGQGSAGLASSPPQYSPAPMQYRYESPTYGASLQSVLPMLMQVGTWMQDMRAKEVGIQSTLTNTERARQMIDFLTQKNPKELESIDNRLSLFPYQKDMQRFLNQKALMGVADMEQDYRFKYGDELFRNLHFIPETPGFTGELGGMRRLQFIQQEAKTRLEQARASWTDFDITNPQAIMQMVMQGMLGLAGQTLRLSTHKRPNFVHELEQRMKGGRTTIRRRIVK